MEIVTFRVAGQRYGVRMQDVREMLLAVAVAPLPGAPSVVTGVLDLRGTIVPLLDLRRRFGAPERALRADEHFIVVVAGERLVALRTDRIDGLEVVADERITPAELLRRTPGPLAGVVPTGDGILLIADVPAFLSEAEATVLDELLCGTAGLVAG